MTVLGERLEMRVLIFDNTGKAGGKFRRDILREELAAKGCAADPLKRVDEPVGSLVLAHSSDTSAALRTDLLEAAGQGARVVLYSGAPHMEEKEERIGRGVRFILRWPTLAQIIKSLPAPFDLDDFEKAYQATRKRELLDALVILSWCAVFPSGSARIKERQQQWRTSREKWQRVFAVPRDDLLVACGGTKGRKLPDEMSEVQQFIDWVDRTSTNVPSPPSFIEVLGQIKRKFGVVPCSTGTPSAQG